MCQYSIRNVLSLVVVLLFIAANFFPNPNGIINENEYPRVEVWTEKAWGIKGWDQNQNMRVDERDNTILHVKEDIQLAVHMVETYGTVYVHEGTYEIGLQGVDITKELVLEGEDKNKTILDIRSYAHAGLYVKSSYVSIHGFTIINADQRIQDDRCQAGIKIGLSSNFNCGNINIYNNTIRNNCNGIFINCDRNCIDDINISNNSICNNEYDGIIVLNGIVTISDNVICDNGGSGVGLWSGNDDVDEGNVIQHNRVVGNKGGIYLDSSDNNMIFHNNVYENQYGVIFVDTTTKKFGMTGKLSEHNQIDYNYIESNDYGIYLYHGKENDFCNNTIKNNKICGFKIEHFIIQYDWIEYFSFDKFISTDNDIYRNNFVNNGKNGTCNALETILNSGNNWCCCNDDKLCGNFWSDYIDRYEKTVFDDRNGTWEDAYTIPFFIFNVSFKGLISRNHDAAAYCRMNGWINDHNQPKRPSLKLLGSSSKNISIPLGEDLTFVASTTDINEDQIKYGFNWSSKDNTSFCESNSTLQVDRWADNTSCYYWSGEETSQKDLNTTHVFDKKGVFYVRVIAADICPFDDRSDGMCRLWSEPIKVNVE